MLADAEFPNEVFHGGRSRRLPRVCEPVQHIEVGLAQSEVNKSAIIFIFTYLF
jgi:hypothetical protein